MILPFVRELLADAEATSSFQRAATHLKGGAGRLRVSGLTPTARALHYALLHRAAARPLLLVVSDNRTAEELLPLLQSLCEMTGVAAPDSVTYLPARDVLPFENLSPHPEIQEVRARALWRIASEATMIPLLVAELEKAQDVGSCDMILLALAETGAPVEAVSRIVSIIESPEEALSQFARSAQFARSNLAQHARQVLSKIDPEAATKIGRAAP